jgi:hypothetical protein
MLPLNDPKWKKFRGGYKVEYDASIPLIKLEQQTASLDEIWEELWEELHHQGDVGIASYAAIPHLVRIVQEHNIFDWNSFGLVVCIELCRGQRNNPKIPKWLKADYEKALSDLAKYSVSNFEKTWDAEILEAVLSLLALVKGNRDLAELIFEVDENDIKELLNKYFDE